MATKNTTLELGLCYTMHKVGSSTVMQAFREAGMAVDRGFAENIDSLSPIDFYKAVVVPVRDPIARNISLFFETFGDVLLVGDFTLDRMLEHFMAEITQTEPLGWFEKSFEPVFGVNVYKQRFAKSRGWSIIDERYLIIQTERMSDQLPQAFEALLGVKIPPVHRADTMETRPYGNLYKEFLEWVRMPEAFVRNLYDSKYMKHFYLKSKIERLAERWTSGK